MKNQTTALLLLASMLAACTPDKPADPPMGPQPADADDPSQAPVPADRLQRKPSAGGVFMVDLESGTVPVPMNRIHSWFVTISGPDGTPVTGARLSFDGGMPAHDHGFPTQPRVHGETNAGRYRIDGVKFSMSGWWRMEIAIASGERIDAVAFDLDVAP